MNNFGIIKDVSACQKLNDFVIYSETLSINISSFSCWFYMKTIMRSMSYQIPKNLKVTEIKLQQS